MGTLASRFCQTVPVPKCLSSRACRGGGSWWTGCRRKLHSLVAAGSSGPGPRQHLDPVPGRHHWCWCGGHSMARSRRCSHLKCRLPRTENENKFFNLLTTKNEKFTDFRETSTACSSWYTELQKLQENLHCQKIWRKFYKYWSFWMEHYNKKL